MWPTSPMPTHVYQNFLHRFCPKLLHTPPPPTPAQILQNNIPRLYYGGHVCMAATLPPNKERADIYWATLKENSASRALSVQAQRDTIIRGIVARTPSGTMDFVSKITRQALGPNHLLFNRYRGVKWEKRDADDWATSSTENMVAISTLKMTSHKPQILNFRLLGAEVILKIIQYFTIWKVPIRKKEVKNARKTTQGRWFGRPWYRRENNITDATHPAKCLGAHLIQVRARLGTSRQLLYHLADSSVSDLCCTGLGMERR
jgi:hypothetical protein